MVFRFRLAPLLVRADVVPADQAAEIAGPVAADVDAVADVVLDKAAVAETQAATLVEAHRTVAAIASPFQQGDRVRVALWRGPFACAVLGW
jgi:hypothetical protein